jgi:hypothetical protein
MERASFEPPLSDDQLKELGRLVVNCGFVEFLLGMHAGMLLDIPHFARLHLVNPLSTRRKIDILTGGLDKIPKATTRSLVEKGCKLASPTIPERNLLLHGIWGFDSDKPDSKAVVGSTKGTADRLYPENITKTADVLAVASRNLFDALVVDGGGIRGETQERLVVKL